MSTFSMFHLVKEMKITVLRKVHKPQYQGSSILHRVLSGLKRESVIAAK